MSSRLHRRALLLSYFTVSYNILGGVLSIPAGSLADSIALIGFGLDSFVESLSGGIVIWRFRLHGKVSEEEEEKAEGRLGQGIREQREGRINLGTGFDRPPNSKSAKI